MAKRLDTNCVPLLVMILTGTPYLATHPWITASATVAASMETKGTNSNKQLLWLIMDSTYLNPLPTDVVKGPAMSRWIFWRAQESSMAAV